MNFDMLHPLIKGFQLLILVRCYNFAETRADKGLEPLSTPGEATWRSPCAPRRNPFVSSDHFSLIFRQSVRSLQTRQVSCSRYVTHSASCGLWQLTRSHAEIIELCCPEFSASETTSVPSTSVPRLACLALYSCPPVFTELCSVKWPDRKSQGARVVCGLGRSRRHAAILAGIGARPRPAAASK